MQELQNSFPMLHAWLIPGLPLISAAVILVGIRPFSARLSAAVATLTVFACAVLSWWLGWLYVSSLSHGDGQGPTQWIPWTMEWVRFQPGLAINMGVLVDALSLCLMVVVTTVSFFVHVYSLGYMHGEAGYGRYFGVLNFFTGAMLGLVVSTNIAQMYIFWELVGVSSFLLIGFYFDRPAAVSASKKAFIVTRFADLGFFLGILVLGYYGFTLLPSQDPFDFAAMASSGGLETLRAFGPIFLGLNPLELGALLVFMGAAGKSAMFPLHIWLPDAMEGPTPVSALIHAATMVVAGVYLVARMFPIFAAAGATLEFVAMVGAFTCFFAALIGCTQNDIKRVLAFSTLSQIGYMMFGLGMASQAGYSASLFHLVTHAFFKAMLFLCAGSVIHAVHSNDIQKMGGLMRKMPFTHLAFLIGGLSIAGIWPFSGFFSKEEILLAAWDTGHHGIFLAGLVVAALTPFYMFRVYFLVFHGKARDQGADHAHEGGPLLVAPLMGLAILSIASGFIPFGHWIAPGIEHAPAHGGMHAWLPLIGSALAVAGIGVAWFIYGRAREQVESAQNALYRIIQRKFYIDEAYLFVTHRVIFRRVAAPIAWFDRNVVDGAVNASGKGMEASSRGLGLLQTGQVQAYGVWLVGGVVGVALMLWGIAKWV